MPSSPLCVPCIVHQEHTRPVVESQGVEIVLFEVIPGLTPGCVDDAKPEGLSVLALGTCPTAGQGQVQGVDGGKEAIGGQVEMQSAGQLFGCVSPGTGMDHPHGLENTQGRKEKSRTTFGTESHGQVFCKGLLSCHETRHVGLRNVWCHDALFVRLSRCRLARNPRSSASGKQGSDSESSHEDRYEKGVIAMFDGFHCILLGRFWYATAAVSRPSFGLSPGCPSMSCDWELGLRPGQSFQ